MVQNKPARKLKVIDPVKPQETISCEDRGGDGQSPFDPPDAYSPPGTVDVDVEDMHPFLQGLVREHEEHKERTRDFEGCLESLQTERALSRDVHVRLGAFFNYFDTEFLAHNRREEHDLFPLVKVRLLEKGEHSPTEVTGVDILTNEHLTALKSATTISTLLSLIPALKDQESREIVLDLAIGGGKDLVEMINLHIFREDNVIFGLAQTLLTSAELDQIAAAAVEKTASAAVEKTAPAAAAE